MNQVFDKAFLQVPFLRLAEIVEEMEKNRLTVVKKPTATEKAYHGTIKPSVSVVPAAVRQMIKEMDHFVAARPIQRKDMTLGNWKASLEIPLLASGNRQSKSV